RRFALAHRHDIAAAHLSLHLEALRLKEGFDGVIEGGLESPGGANRHGTIRSDDRALVSRNVGEGVPGDLHRGVVAPVGEVEQACRSMPRDISVFRNEYGCVANAVEVAFGAESPAWRRQAVAKDGQGARRSWGSMVRTARAAVAVLLIGGIGLTLPPQTRDMLAFLDGNRVSAAISFQLALIVFGGSAWFWSRAALAARFGIDDSQRRQPPSPDFDWVAFTWLPRLMLIATFLVGLVIAIRSQSFWTVAGAAMVGGLALLITIVRPHRASAGPPPAPRGGVRTWIRGGASARLRALIQRAPFGAGPAVALLALGLVPLVLGLIEAFTSALLLPNRLALLFPGPAIALLLLGLMIGPLVAATFVCDGLTLQWRMGRLRLGLRRPPVLILILLYVFVFVPALFDVHTVRVIDAEPARRQSLDTLFAVWTRRCAPA